MNNSEKLTTEEKLKFEVFLEKPQTQEELRNWFYVYLNLELPDTHLPGEGSNTSPMEAVWESYQNYVNNKGGEIPGYVWLSSRDSMKTLGASMLATALMVFCDATICWLASIEPQSRIALSNIQSFIRTITPYLEYHKKSIESNNARNLEIIDSSGKRSLINILVATMASVNGRHVNIVMTDEVDLVRDPKVLDEVQAVASLIGGQFPLKVYFSTRKFSFGNMEGIIERSSELGLKILKWDILDVTEHCSVTRRINSQRTEDIYVHPDPPLRAVAPDDFSKLTGPEKKHYDKIKVFKGCVDCKLVSQCRGRLGERPEKDNGKLWKKIDHTINMFRSMSPDMASAQLLCKKPSLSGLVYPRYTDLDNSVFIDDAINSFTGEPVSGASMKDIADLIRKHQIPVYVGVDWGSTASQAFVVTALMPNDEWWILESYAITEMEFDEILQLGKKIRDTYEPKKWFADTNQPIFIKEFNKNGMRCAEFKKDVTGGIECVRGRITDSMGKKRLKVIKDPSDPNHNSIMLLGLKRHHFKLDALGRPTKDPDDGKAWSDICDALRYIAQNLFTSKNNKPYIGQEPNPRARTDAILAKDPQLTEIAKELNKEIMTAKISEYATEPSPSIDDTGNKRGKRVFWSTE